MRRKIFTEANMIKVKTMAEEGYGAAQIAYEIRSTPGSGGDAGSVARVVGA
jgi:hypothetical protein